MAIPDSLDLLRQLSWPWRLGLGGLLGLVIGSYLATVFVRWPKGRSANSGRSRCDGCDRQLQWFEMFPVLSWLMIGRRCRTCGRSIDPAHTAIEVLCGVAGGAAFSAGLPLLAPMAWLLVVLCFFDAVYLWLPDRLVLLLACACLVAPSPDAGVTLRLAGGVIGFAVLYAISAGYRNITGKIGLGGGDPKLFGAIGLWCGALQLPTVMLLACAIGIADAIWRRMKSGERAAIHLPLGTYLGISSMGVAALDIWTSLQLPANLTVAAAT